jgi:hypothetical protein
MVGASSLLHFPLATITRFLFVHDSFSRDRSTSTAILGLCEAAGSSSARISGVTVEMS